MEFEERYFREELDYLRQLSKLLATEKPHLARFLAEKDADPDGENSGSEDTGRRGFSYRQSPPEN